MIDTQKIQDTVRAKGPNTVANALAIIGFIILIVIVIWGLFHLATLSSSWFGDFLDRKPSSKITVTAPSSAESGKPITISWKYSTKEPGSYAFMYQCVQGVQFAAPGPNNTVSPVPCGAAVGLGNATTSFVTIPLSTATSSAKTQLTILYIATGQNRERAQAQGSVSITVTPPQGTTPAEPTPSQQRPGTPEPTPPAGGPRPSTPSGGPADLAVTIVSVTVDQFGNGTASFDIANRGGSASGAYTFTAQLPTSQPYTYFSPVQVTLSPGSHVMNTLRFTMGNGGVFSVSVDPSNAVRESNESNNVASQSVYTTGGPLYMGAPTYYPTQQTYPQQQYYQPYPTYQYGY